MKPEKLLKIIAQYASERGWLFTYRQGQTAHRIITLTEPNGRKRTATISYGKGKDISIFTAEGIIKQLNLKGEILV
jgi:hypothetical protein